MPHPKLPEVVSVKINPSSEAVCSVHYEFAITENLIYFQGHFPKFAILPGVTQIHWVMHYAQAHGALGTFKRIERLKFKRPVLPGKQLQLTLKIDNARGIITFKFICDSHEYSLGRIIMETANG